MTSNLDIRLTSGGKMNSQYLSHALSSFLPAEDKEKFIAACGRPLRKSVRVNRLKSSVEAFQKLADKYHWSLETIPWCSDGFWITHSEEPLLSLGNTPEHIQGLFYIQEASSMLPPIALLEGGVIDSPLVVDMAAAPGSKTTQLAAMLNNNGIVLANELSASRLKSLHNNLVRCGILNTAMSHLDARKIGEFAAELFDFVLLDAPCGGEGTVRKDPMALNHWQLEKVNELAALQKELVQSAYRALKPGGKLVYSTCTLSMEENQQVANYLIDQTDAQICSLKNLFDGAEKATTTEGYLHVLPHTFDSEGFFVACFSKPEIKHSSVSLAPIYTSPFTALSKKTKTQFEDYYQQHFGIAIEPPGYQLLQRDKAVWLFPEDIERINQFIKVNRAGMKIGDIYPNKIRSTHEFASCLGLQASKQVVDISDEELVSFLRGNNLNIDATGLANGEVLLRYQHHIVGIAQNQKGKLKNGLPRELVKDNFQLGGVTR